MKLIIPMAGIGKRMRPHTLTVPKPLISFAGMPIVERLVKDIAKVSHDKFDEIGFIIGDFGKEVEENLIKIGNSIGAKSKIFYQDEALGTAHAILCAKEILNGPVIVAFADTLFIADFKLDTSMDSVIWVSKVNNPSSFGIVKINEKDQTISEFFEKPKEFISDLAIIGIYYFKDGKNLCNELQFLIDNNIVKNSEYQLTDALDNMKNKGMKFYMGKVDEWLDCGNKDATVYTNERILENYGSNIIKENIHLNKSVIIKPCYIGKNVKIENSLIGPYVSIGNNCIIKNTNINKSIVQNNTKVINANITNSMIGNNVEYNDSLKELNIGDYSEYNKKN